MNSRVQTRVNFCAVSGIDYDRRDRRLDHGWTADFGAGPKAGVIIDRCWNELAVLLEKDISAPFEGSLGAFIFESILLELRSFQPAYRRYPENKNFFSSLAISRAGSINLLVNSIETVISLAQQRLGYWFR